MNIFNGVDLKNFDYNVYWENRSVKIRQKLLEREGVFFDWIKPKTKVLDIAVGNSGLLSSLKKNKMCDVYAFDISQKVVDAQNEEGIIAEKRDISVDDFNNIRKCDFLILSEILEHLPLPEMLMNKLSDKADFFLISIPNSAFYKFRLSLLFGRFFKQWIFHPAEHLRFWSHHDFLSWAKAMGFEVVKHQASNGLDVGPLKLYKYMPNLFGHQICYLLKAKNK
ncbi:MAG: class I SAM-dependent methyltransferase [Patescibacteria group bacterium]